MDCNKQNVCYLAWIHDRVCDLKAIIACDQSDGLMKQQAQKELNNARLSNPQI